MRWATVMLATVMMLGSASLAVAECRWVLWTRVDTDGDSGPVTNWELEAAYENHAQCKTGREDALKRSRQFWGENAGIQREYVDEQTGEKQVVIEFEFTIRPGQKAGKVRTVYCRWLPDIIDAREKKEDMLRSDRVVDS